jgi:type VI secretion system protein ImpH
VAVPSRKLNLDVERNLVDLLRERPFDVRFFEAVRVLRRLLPHCKQVGHFVPPGSEAVRFVAHPSLMFPASEIQSLEWKDGSETPIKMMVNFMGLAAPNGVLPPPYIELIIERSQRRNDGFRDFLDIFNHRFISLFYRAWEKHHFFVSYEMREIDPLTPLLFTFIGLGTKGLLRRQEIEDQSLAYYAGLIAQHPRSAQALRQILEDYFEVSVAIEQFVGRWVRLSLRDQTRFDDDESIHVQLGRGVVAGDEMWDQQSTVLVKLGPLSRMQYMDFLPTPKSKGYPALKSLLKFYANDQLDFEVQLILRREEAPAFELNDEPENNLMLGWVSWIKNVPLGRDPGEAILQM